MITFGKCRGRCKAWKSSGRFLLVLINTSAGVIEINIRRCSVIRQIDVKGVYRAFLIVESARPFQFRLIKMCKQGRNKWKIDLSH